MASSTGGSISSTSQGHAAGKIAYADPQFQDDFANVSQDITCPLYLIHADTRLLETHCLAESPAIAGQAVLVNHSHYLVSSDHRPPLRISQIRPLKLVETERTKAIGAVRNHRSGILLPGLNAAADEHAKLRR